MKFNITFHMESSDKKGKTEDRLMVIEAESVSLAGEWAEKQAKYWDSRSWASR